MSSSLTVEEGFQKGNQMEWDQAVAKLAALAMQEDACCLQMGDHLNVIEKQWKGRGKMKLAAQEAGVTWALARQRSWVAKRIMPGHPLRDTPLTYCHLRAVAGTNDPEGWGMKALQNNWSLAKLKEEIDLAEDKQAQQTGETCIYCEAAMSEEMEIVSFRVGQKRTSRCCGIVCAAKLFERMVKEQDNDTTPAMMVSEDEAFSL
jgi:hypothetical protein